MINTNINWTKIDWILVLGIGYDGYTEVLIDSVNIISTLVTNVPDQNIFSEYVIILDYPNKYDAIEIGISANSGNNNIEIYILTILWYIKKCHNKKFVAYKY